MATGVWRGDGVPSTPKEALGSTLSRGVWYGFGMVWCWNLSDVRLFPSMIHPHSHTLVDVG